MIKADEKFVVAREIIYFTKFVRTQQTEHNNAKKCSMLELAEENS